MKNLIQAHQRFANLRAYSVHRSPMADSRQNGGIKEWYAEWINSLGFTKLRLCTQASYKQQVWPFIEYAEIAKLDPLDFRTVEKYLSFLQFERKLAGSSASLSKKCIRVFLRWLYRRGYSDRWIATYDILPIQTSKGKSVENLGEEKIRTMLENLWIVQNSKTQDAIRYFLFMKWYTNLKTPEMACVRWSDVKWGECRIILNPNAQNRKIKNSPWILMPPGLAGYLSFRKEIQNPDAEDSWVCPWLAKDYLSSSLAFRNHFYSFRKKLRLNSKLS